MNVDIRFLLGCSKNVGNEYIRYIIEMIAKNDKNSIFIFTVYKLCVEFAPTVQVCIIVLVNVVKAHLNYGTWNQETSIRLKKSNKQV
jgi:hypothetical protein